MPEADTKTAPCFLDLEWHAPWSGGEGTGVACGEPSNATLTLSCVHEHIDKGRICWGCAVDVQQAAGMLTCPHCTNGPEAHPCYTLVVIDWDSGEKTIVQEAGR